MTKVEKTIRDIRAIRLLFIFDIVLISMILITAFFRAPKPGLLVVTCVLAIPLIACILLQLRLYFSPKGKIIFDSNGVTIVTKDINTCVSWDNVKCIYYNSFSDIFVLFHFTIDLYLKINGEIVDFDAKFGNIKIYKEDYLQIISFIPRHVLDNNEFMIYRSYWEKNKNEYNI